MSPIHFLCVHLREFEDCRSKTVFPSPNEREEYAKKIAECFKPCAQWILAGHFVVKNKVGGKTSVREIYPTVIELYYHEEGNGKFKDPIMYHTNDRKWYEFYKDKYEEYKDRPGRKSYFDKRRITELPYYPLGYLNPHPSGIDVTFENAEKQYRASFLIREYEASFDGGKRIPIPNSTDLYDDMLLNGISTDENNWIEWADGDAPVTLAEPIPRKNVSAYVKYNDSPELWKKVKAEIFNPNKPVFKNCTFNWQFKAKKD